MIAEASYDDVLRIRNQVMYPEKDVNYVKLANDKEGIHMGYFIDEKPVSVFSIFLENNKIQFRKFATLIEYQRKGYGSKLIEWLLKYASDMQFESVWCNSRYDKRNFYKSFGFKETNKIFERDGIKYVILEIKING